MTGWLDKVGQALHPLVAPPERPAWNHAALAELPGEEPRADAAVLVLATADCRTLPGTGRASTLFRKD